MPDEITDDTIAELAASPRKITTDEGVVEERSIDEIIKADQHLGNKNVTDQPLHGLRISRFKPGGSV